MFTKIHKRAIVCMIAVAIILLPVFPVNASEMVPQEDVQEYVSDEVLVVFRNTVNVTSSVSTTEEYNSVLNQLSLEEIDVMEECCASVEMFVEGTEDVVAVLKTQDGMTVEDAIQELEALDSIKYVQPNYIYYPDSTSVNDPYQGWQLDSIDTYNAWDVVKSNGNVIVAVIDTGVDTSHSDLKNVIYEAVDVVNGTPEVIKDSHGTAVAGIIAAQANNAVGTVGVSYNAKILSINASDYNVTTGKSVFYTSDLITAMQYAVSKGVSVINMSLGSLRSDGISTYDQLLFNEIDAAANKGIVCVCSAGNNGSSTYHFPSDYETCISVIWLNANNIKNASSNYGPQKDVSAPGTGLTTTALEDSVRQDFSGTSAAAPVVSGVVALMKAADASLTVNEVKNILYSTAEDLGTAGRDDTYGYGKVDAYQAALGAKNYAAIKAFVNNTYVKVLGRTASEDELLNCCAEILSGKTGTEIMQYFFFSNEFINMNKSDNDYVELLYQGILNRNASSSEKATYVQMLSVGMSREYVFYCFTNATEFSNRCQAAGITPGSGSSTEPRDQNYNVTAFVYRLYQKCLGRTPDVDGLNTWTNALLTGSESGKSVARGFFFADEFVNKNVSDTEYVTLLYQTLLDRNPDTSGLNTWTSLLASGTSRLEVFNGIADSQEFKNLCNQYGISYN